MPETEYAIWDARAVPPPDAVVSATSIPTALNKLGEEHAEIESFIVVPTRNVHEIMGKAEPQPPKRNYQELDQPTVFDAPPPKDA